MLHLALTPLLLGSALATGSISPLPPASTTDLLNDAILAHNALAHGRVVITTRSSRTFSRGLLAFQRATSASPAQFRYERWHGRGGPLDLISNGRNLASSNPVRRSWRLSPAPTSFKTAIHDNLLTSDLGTGATLLLSWLSDAGATFKPSGSVRRSFANNQATLSFNGTAPGPTGPTPVSFTFAATDTPLLLEATFDLPNHGQLSITFEQWSTAPQPSSSFAISPPSMETASASSLVGSIAPMLPTRKGETSTRFVLFWSDTSSMDREAKRSFEAIAQSLESLGAVPIAIHLDRDRASTALHADPAHTSEAWHLNGEPTFIVIDAKGIVRAVQVGHPGEDELRRRFNRAAHSLNDVAAASDE